MLHKTEGGLSGNLRTKTTENLLTKSDRVTSRNLPLKPDGVYGALQRNPKKFLSRKSDQTRGLRTQAQ